MTEEPRVRTDFLDFATAWAIQNARLIKHTSDECSAVQTDAFLCDCDGVAIAWRRLVEVQSGTPAAEAQS